LTYPHGQRPVTGGDSGGISPNRQQMANPRRERQAIFLGATEPRAAETSLLI
jgi:hypothetical protein